MMNPIVSVRPCLASRNHKFVARARSLGRAWAVMCLLAVGCDDQGCAGCAPPLAQSVGPANSAPLLATGTDGGRAAITAPPARPAATTRARVADRGSHRARVRVDASAPTISTGTPASAAGEGTDSGAAPWSSREPTWWPANAPEGGVPEQTVRPTVASNADLDGGVDAGFLGPTDMTPIAPTPTPDYDASLGANDGSAADAGVDFTFLDTPDAAYF